MEDDMLKNIPVSLTPDLLKILMEMGHCDELVICDGNFPKFAQPDRIIYCTGLGTVKMLDDIMQFFPLDSGEEEPFIQMAVSEGDNYIPPTWPLYEDVILKNEKKAKRKKFLSRNEFYSRTKKAYAAVITGEETFYATIILKKGTIGNG